MLDIGRLEPCAEPTALLAANAPTATALAEAAAPFALARAAMIGNFPPRRCGIATFTRDHLDGLAAASPGTRWEVVALDDGRGPYEFPARVTRTIAQNDADDYRAAGDALNRSGVEAVFIQHEFGIFGGPAGEHLLILMRRLRMPVIVTLHTVLENPNPDQKRVMEEIVRLADAVVVMAEKGADILARNPLAGPSKVHVVPHGAPHRPFAATDKFKAKLGLAGRDTVMTFGLLSPNKGIETIIRALPAIIARRPKVAYLIVGATHPHLVAREGEHYRETLSELARSLGVEKHIQFVNRYLDQEELVDILQATDVYATPYLTESQITSGTLSYAIALGKPIVSSPYWHAVEALAGGVGAVAPFGDVDTFAREIADLLSNDMRRAAMARKAYKAGTASRWVNVGRSYLELVEAVRAVRAARPKPSLRALTRPSMTAVKRLFDDVGIAQHAKFRVPDRRHGYCLDDNARALSLFARLARDGDQGDADGRLAYAAAGFVNHAWNEEKGRFRNFMSYGRDWLDDGGCDDCSGRAYHALALAARDAAQPDLRDWAKHLGRGIHPHTSSWRSLRAQAHVMKASLAAEGAFLPARDVEANLRAGADDLLRALAENAPWFDPKLAYENALLPEVLILAGARLDDAALLQQGLDALDWLAARQTSSDECFRPVPTADFAQSPAPPGFDQQPLEAMASIEAYCAAFAVTGADVWAERAIAAFAWFAGENDLALPLVTPDDGGCFDGLTQTGANQNQGAESVLSYHLASAAMRGLFERRGGAPLEG